MLNKNALSDSVHFFHTDALSPTAMLKVDFDMGLHAIGSSLCRLLACRMRGYGDAQARQIFRDVVARPATLAVTTDEVIVAFRRRAHLRPERCLG